MPERWAWDNKTDLVTHSQLKKAFLRQIVTTVDRIARRLKSIGST
jgi:hypothetical protein